MGHVHRTRRTQGALEWFKSKFGSGAPPCELRCRVPSTALAWLLAIGLACFAVREANGPGGGVLRSGAAVLGGALLLARASSLALTG